MLTIERVPAQLFDANAYVISAGDGAPVLVVDPGPGVAAALSERGIETGAVLLTHGHPDHTWDAAEVSRMGDGVPVFLPSPDREWLDDPAGKLGFGSFGQWEAPLALDVPLGDWQVLPGVVLHAVPAPGHSPGSTVFLIGGTTDVGTPTALTGDVIFKGSIGRTDLPGGDQAEMDETLRTLAAVLDPATTLLPGHGQKTVWSEELATNPYVKDARTGR